MIFSRKNTEAKSLDERSIGVLYDRHAPWLLGVCLHYMGNREDAEDVMHDGFLSIIRSIGGFQEKPTGSLEAWMRRIMVNTALKYLRDHKKERMTTELDPSLESLQEPDHQEDYGGCDLTQDQLMGLVCELPTGYRIVFNLYVMEEYTHKEIGELLGISENTSKSQLSKARGFLRKRLIEYQNKTNYAKAGSIR
jgi:RNA polymerase sigma-70 factor (ECF subfamily)